jgi:hypothetical protein
LFGSDGGGGDFVALDAGDVAADLLHGLVQGAMPGVPPMMTATLPSSFSTVIPLGRWRRVSGATILSTPSCFLTITGGRLEHKLCTPVVT